MIPKPFYQVGSSLGTKKSMGVEVQDGAVEVQPVQVPFVSILEALGWRFGYVLDGSICIYICICIDIVLVYIHAKTGILHLGISTDTEYVVYICRCCMKI